MRIISVSRNVSPYSSVACSTPRGVGQGSSPPPVRLAQYPPRFGAGDPSEGCAARGFHALGRPRHAPSGGGDPGIAGRAPGQRTSFFKFRREPPPHWIAPSHGHLKLLGNGDRSIFCFGDGKLHRDDGRIREATAPARRCALSLDENNSRSTDDHLAFIDRKIGRPWQRPRSGPAIAGPSGARQWSGYASGWRADRCRPRPGGFGGKRAFVARLFA
jgi:hypothetical protein